MKPNSIPVSVDSGFRLGRMFRPVMMSSSRFSICSSDSSMKPWAWGTAADEGSAGRFEGAESEALG